MIKVFLKGQTIFSFEYESALQNSVQSVSALECVLACVCVLLLLHFLCGCNLDSDNIIWL